MNINEINIFGTIMIAIIGGLFAFYKFLEDEFEKKVDKLLYDRELEFLKKEINNNGKNIYSLLEKLKDEIVRIRNNMAGQKLDED